MLWHDALWSTMRQFHRGSNLANVTKQLFKKATSTVCINGQLGEWFCTHGRVRHGCLVSPNVFNFILEILISDVLEDHVGSVSITGRAIKNLRFTDDINSLASSEEDLKALTECTNRMAKSNGMKQCQQDESNDEQHRRYGRDI